MLLAERLRNEEERVIVKNVIEKELGRIDMTSFYQLDTLNSIDAADPNQLWSTHTLTALREEVMREYAESVSAVPSGLKSIAITCTLKKLFKLIGLCLQYDEPVLLVGGTGCGKTTAVQLVAKALKQKLVILNWYPS